MSARATAGVRSDEGAPASGAGPIAASPAGHTLTLSGISHRFGAVLAVDAVTLEIAAGELIALLGPSGCGKTTLLRIIAGFINQTAGSVLVDGDPLDGQPPNRRGVGIVFQNYALFPHMTVAENIAYGLDAQGRPRARTKAVIADMLALVQMSDFADRLPRQLSGGQQQRIALARCLAVEPRMLLLDEPFGALDKNLRLDMQIEIKNLQRQCGITTILVTHDQEEALSMANRIAVLNAGRVEQFAAPTEIYDRPATMFVNAFVGTTNLLPGRLAEKSAGRCRVDLDCGASLTCDASTDCRPGDRVVFSVRPERLRLVDGAGEGVLPAKVRAVMPLGPQTVYEAAVADGSAVKVVEDRAAAERSLNPGDQIFLALTSSSACAVFAAPEPPAN